MSMDDLKNDLQQVERNYAELDQEQPPAGVDQAVLRAAAKAVQPRKRSWPWTRGWTHNLATAAVVLLAVTLLLQLKSESPLPAPVRLEPGLTESAIKEEQATQGFTVQSDAVQLEPEQVAPPTHMSEEVAGPAIERRALKRTPAADTSNANAGTARERMAEVPVAAKAAAPAAVLIAEDEPIPSDSVVTTKEFAEETLGAEARLEKIRQLLADGKQEEAMKALAEFQEQFPDYAIPDDLSQ